MTFLPFFRKMGFGGNVRDCAMASKQSEQDTLRVTQLEIGNICSYMCGHIYVMLYSDPPVFMC